jgi:hypothetical protein
VGLSIGCGIDELVMGFGGSDAGNCPLAGTVRWAGAVCFVSLAPDPFVFRLGISPALKSSLAAEEMDEIKAAMSLASAGRDVDAGSLGTSWGT